MPTEPSYQTHVNKSRDLIDMVDRLNQEYTALLEVSYELRKESRQLSEDSRVLRRMGTRLLLGETP